MKKWFVILVIVFIVGIGIVSAHKHNLDEVKQLIDSEINCDKLTDEQLEMIGEYYMEQMHPGEAHEMMDEMMGGEGSENLKQVHIQMAKMFYCKEDVGGMMGSGGMMNMMIGGGNMMGNYGMMGGYGYGMGIFGWIISLLVIVVLVLLIIWLLKQIQKK